MLGLLTTLFPSTSFFRNNNFVITRPYIFRKSHIKEIYHQGDNECNGQKICNGIFFASFRFKRAIMKFKLPEPEPFYLDVVQALHTFIIYLNFKTNVTILYRSGNQIKQ